MHSVTSVKPLSIARSLEASFWSGCWFRMHGGAGDCRFWLAPDEGPRAFEHEADAWQPLGCFPGPECKGMGRRNLVINRPKGAQKKCCWLIWKHHDPSKNASTNGRHEAGVATA